MPLIEQEPFSGPPGPVPNGLTSQATRGKEGRASSPRLASASRRTANLGDKLAFNRCGKEEGVDILHEQRKDRAASAGRLKGGMPKQKLASVKILHTVGTRLQQAKKEATDKHRKSSLQESRVPLSSATSGDPDCLSAASDATNRCQREGPQVHPLTVDSQVQQGGGVFTSAIPGLHRLWWSPPKIKLASASRRNASVMNPSQS